MNEKEQEEFKRPILERYEREGHPFYSSARLWDDGIIRPRDTRRILGLNLQIAQATRDTKFGIFRM